MTTSLMCRTILLSATLVCALSTRLQAGLLTNIGFEAGLAGWTTANQVGSEGSFLLQTGTQSPLTMTVVPPPPEGTNAAMTDATGPGSHVLYQDFVVPLTLPGAVVTFSLFVNNVAPDFFVAPHLDFANTDLDPLLRINQQARVDIMTTTADPFSVAAGDILQTLFQTQPGDPLVSGYNNFRINITPLLLAHQGETLRLRFAEVDNVLNFNFGVDNVDVNIIPEPSTWIMMAGALTGLWLARHRAHLR
jgi:hypothetical protein